MWEKKLDPEDRYRLINKYRHIIGKIEELKREKKLDESLIKELVEDMLREEKIPSEQGLKVLCKNPSDTVCLSSIYSEVSRLFYGVFKNSRIAVDAVEELTKMLEELIKENPENGNIGIAIAAGVCSRFRSLIEKMKEDPEIKRYYYIGSIGYSSIRWYTHITGIPAPAHLDRALQLLEDLDVRSKAIIIYLLSKYAGWETLALRYIKEISKIEEQKIEPTMAILSNIEYDSLRSDLLEERKDLDQKIRDYLLGRLQNLPEEHIKVIAERIQKNYGWKPKSYHHDPEVLIPLLYILEKVPSHIPSLEEIIDILERYPKDVREFYKLLKEILGERADFAYGLGFIVDNYDLIKRVLSSPLFKQYRNSEFVKEVFFEIFADILPYRRPLTEKGKRYLLSFLEKAERAIPHIQEIDNMIKISKKNYLTSIVVYLILDVFKYNKDMENIERRLNEVKMVFDTAIKIAEKYGLKDWTTDAKLSYDKAIKIILKDDSGELKNYMVQILEDAGSRSKVVSEIQKRLGIEIGIWNRTLGPIYLLSPGEIEYTLDKLLRDKGVRNAEGILSSFLEKLRERISNDYAAGKLDKEAYELLSKLTSNDYYIVSSGLMDYYKLAYSNPERRDAILSYVRYIVGTSLE